MKKQPLVERAEQLMEPFLSDLKTIVNIDSGTYTKSGVDRVGAYLQERFQQFGFTTRVEKVQEYGDHLIAMRTGKNPRGARILLIGHMDTVLPDGDAQKRPFTISKRGGMRIATGPGVLDMKSGLLIGMYGLHLLAEAGESNYQSVTCFWNSDEEIGSPSSKPFIQEIAKHSDAVIVLEPGRAIGSVVSSRRGSGQYHLEVRGVAAHAGVEPQNGRNAIHELAHKVLALQALNGNIPGVTLSVGIIHGGERTNVVPDFAYCEMDVRVSDARGLQAIEAALHRIAAKTFIDGTQTTVSGGMRSMPFEKSKRNELLVQLTKEVGSELGLKIQDLGSGGASDANNTAALGIPTIDGLGAGGGLAHNPGEYIELDYLPTRIALLAGLVQRIGVAYAPTVHDEG
jgi:glutamate carboxypeptidase